MAPCESAGGTTAHAFWVYETHVAAPEVFELGHLLAVSRNIAGRGWTLKATSLFPAPVKTSTFASLATLATLALLAAAVTVAAPSRAFADEPDAAEDASGEGEAAPGPDELGGPAPERVGSDYATGWTGVYWGFGVIGGVQVSSNDAFEETLGWVAGAQARLSFALHLMDFQLTYLRGSSTPTTTGLGGPVELEVTTDGVSASIAIHPLFIAMPIDPFWGVVFASLHILGGASLEHATFAGPAGAFEQDWTIAWHLGGGLDIPLTDQNAGSSLWVGGQYRFNTYTTDVPALEAVEEDFYQQHFFLVSLSYRINGLPF